MNFYITFISVVGFLASLFLGVVIYKLLKLRKKEEKKSHYPLIVDVKLSMDY